MSEARDNAGTGLMLFLLGAAVGAIAVALTTPKSGPDLRADLRDLTNQLRAKARKAGEDVRSCAQDMAEDANQG
jgi:gas vesicle protein